MHRLDSSSIKIDTTFYEGGEQADTTYGVGDHLPDTDNDDAADESEVEAIWSDMDLEGNN